MTAARPAQVGAPGRGVDVRHELALEAQFAREIGEKRALALGIGIDGDARGRIDLQRLLARADGGGEIGGARRVPELVLEECLGLRVEPGLPQALDDARLLGLIDAAIGGGRRDHGADVEHCALVGDGLRLEAGAFGRGSCRDRPRR